MLLVVWLKNKINQFYFTFPRLLLSVSETRCEMIWSHQPCSPGAPWTKFKQVQLSVVFAPIRTGVNKNPQPLLSHLSQDWMHTKPFHIDHILPSSTFCLPFHSELQLYFQVSAYITSNINPCEGKLLFWNNQHLHGNLSAP